MKKSLSRVYLDDFPVRLKEDEVRPTLARIVLAGGKNPGRVAVVALASRFGKHGQPLDPYEVIDRAAEPTRPIYLRSLPKHGGAIESPATPAPTTPAPPRNSDPVIEQLGRPLPNRTTRVPPRRAEALAQAEAEAEQRQEEQRDQEDALQDEAEAIQDTDDDRDAQA